MFQTAPKYLLPKITSFCEDLTLQKQRIGLLAPRRVRAVSVLHDVVWLPLELQVDKIAVRQFEMPVVVAVLIGFRSLLFLPTPAS